MNLVIGGTGTLGREIIRQLGPDQRVRIFSRCELKQKELKAEFPHIECVLGDIRGDRSLERAMRGVYTVFHVAALKHVDILEANPEESVKTNVLGTMNVCEAAVAANVGHLLFSSTDKAVSPINVYGMCKGISERIVLNHGYSVYRWGNVLGSRGSAIQYFVDAIRSDKTLNLTDYDMSRFWIRIEDAVAFMLNSDGAKRINLPPNMKAASVVRVVATIGHLLGRTPRVKITGLRPGEKIHESLSRDLHSNTAAQYSETELSDLLAPFCQ